MVDIGINLSHYKVLRHSLGIRGVEKAILRSCAFIQGSNSLRGWRRCWGQCLHGTEAFNLLFCDVFSEILRKQGESVFMGLCVDIQVELGFSSGDAVSRS